MMFVYGRAGKRVPFVDFPNRGAHIADGGLFDQIGGELIIGPLEFSPRWHPCPSGLADPPSRPAPPTAAESLPSTSAVLGRYQPLTPLKMTVQNPSAFATTNRFHRVILNP